MQPVYRLCVLACDECNQLIEAGELKPEQVHASYIWRFENVTVYGDMSVVRWSASKNHGRLLSVDHYQIDSPFHPNRLLVQHNATSPFFQSFRGRAWMRDMLGPKWSRLVNKARKSTKQDWLASLRGGLVKCKIRDFQKTGTVTLPEVFEWNEDKGTYKVWVDADPSLAGAEQRIESKLKMDAEQFWRYASGYQIVPAELLVDDRLKQLSLFDSPQSEE